VLSETMDARWQSGTAPRKLEAAIAPDATAAGGGVFSSERPESRRRGTLRTALGLRPSLDVLRVERRRARRLAAAVDTSFRCSCPPCNVPWAGRATWAVFSEAGKTACWPPAGGVVHERVDRPSSHARRRHAFVPPHRPSSTIASTAPTRYRARAALEAGRAPAKSRGHFPPRGKRSAFCRPDAANCARAVERAGGSRRRGPVAPSNERSRHLRSPSSALA